MPSNLSILVGLAVAALPILGLYAVNLVHAHVKSAGAANAIQAVIALAEVAAHAALTSASPAVAGAAALSATVTTLRRVAADEIALLESLRGTQPVAVLLDQIAARALASVGGAS